jgi:hypothetical protein
MTSAEAMTMMEGQGTGMATPEHSSPEPEWVTIDAIVATSDPVEAYGMIMVLADTALEQMAEAITTGVARFRGHHDPLEGMRIRNPHAYVDVLEDGRRQVRLSGDVLRSEWERLGPVWGMSFATTDPLPEHSWIAPLIEALSVSADAGWFNDSAIAESSASFQRALDGAQIEAGTVGGVAAGRLFQFSAIPGPRIVIETSLALH